MYGKTISEDNEGYNNLSNLGACFKSVLVAIYKTTSNPNRVKIKLATFFS